MNNTLELNASDYMATETFSKKRQLLINGQWRDSQTGETIDVYNPADESVIARVAAGDSADVDIAVNAARGALEHGIWSRMTPTERSNLLWKLGDAIDAHAEELALLETLDVGKPITMSRAVDVASSAERFRYYAGWATKLSGKSLDLSARGTNHGYTMREPIGVCGLIVPWNFPLLMAAGKIAPALAAGCTVILKPAEQTSLSALKLGEIIQEVGFPEGVVNIITGYGATAGAALVDHPDVDKIMFTGSTVTGKRILQATTGNLKRVSLELGGKSPTIVMPDADMETTIAGVANSIFFNAGQVCAAGTRLFAHESVFDELVEGVAKIAADMKIGPGLDPETQMGPVVSAEQQKKVTGYIDAGIAAGAEVVVGGEHLERQGYFVSPTIFTGTTPDMSIRTEEIFGPVLCAMSFSDLDIDKIAADANDTEYGLFSRIYTKDLSVAHKLAGKIKAGGVVINGGAVDHSVPVGGYKQSGWGRENGEEGVLAYTELKSVVIGL